MNSLLQATIASGVTAAGRIWPIRRGKNRFFSTLVLDKAWQPGFAHLMPNIRTTAGFTLHGPAVDYTADWIRVFGNHEVSTEKFIDAHGRPGSTMLDIGSNIGYFSFYSALVRGLKSIAFEPNPKVTAFLRQSVATNQAEARVEIVETALGESDGTARLIPDDTKSDLGGGHMESDPSGEIKVQRLDSLEAVRGPFTNVSVVKIDVEGWELPVLRGMVNFLARERPALAVEDLHGNYTVSNRSAGDLEGILGRFGYVEDRSFREFDQFPSNRFFVAPPLSRATGSGVSQ